MPTLTNFELIVLFLHAEMAMYQSVLNEARKGVRDNRPAALACICEHVIGIKKDDLFIPFHRS